MPGKGVQSECSVRLLLLFELPVGVHLARVAQAFRPAILY